LLEPAMTEIHSCELQPRAANLAFLL